VRLLEARSRAGFLKPLRFDKVDHEDSRVPGEGAPS
jgi:hypothetical protein